MTNNATSDWPRRLVLGGLVLGGLWMLDRATGKMDHGTALLLGGAALYLLPSIVAVIRRHHNAVAIIVLNILLGWSLIGWVVAMVWSATATAKPEPRRNYHQDSIENAIRRDVSRRYGDGE
jgi:hypothetical protein